ncbi:MAG TPA: VWA domain-containing protein [Vicinamibacterales bacterium]|nr:VWA domain-containing protein [Vicinamibacterales bacterium]
MRSLKGLPVGPARRVLLTALSVTLATTLASPIAAQQDQGTLTSNRTAQSAPPVSFRSSINLVSISAVVRNRRGKVMQSLRGDDFQVFDGGVRRQVVDVRADSNAPASVALLVDGSGSMRLGLAQAFSRQISTELLAGLNPARDTAALLSFDTRLLTLCEFTRDFEQVRSRMNHVESFGSTSLYDAVAGSAAMVAERVQNRRAVIVLTDGLDNSSAYSPEKVAWIASTIDVPVYVFDVGDRPADDETHTERGPLAAVAQATGGELFVANTPQLVAAAVKRVTEELRHQYVIAFESQNTGLRRVEIRMRKPDLRVQARNWYQASE